MESLLFLFLLINSLVWVAQAYLDLTRKQIQLYYIIPVLLSVPLYSLEPSLTSFGLLLLAPIQYFTVDMAKGDTSLYIMYVFSTIFLPITSFQVLIFTTAAYILLQETMLQNQNYPMAPAVTTSYFISLLIFLV